MVAPAKTPAAIVSRLNREINAILKQPDLIDQLTREGTLPNPDTAERFAAYIEADIEKWTQVVRSAGTRWACCSWMTCTSHSTSLSVPGPSFR